MAICHQCSILGTRVSYNRYIRYVYNKKIYATAILRIKLFVLNNKTYIKVSRQKCCLEM